MSTVRQRRDTVRRAVWQYLPSELLRKCGMWKWLRPIYAHACGDSHIHRSADSDSDLGAADRDRHRDKHVDGDAYQRANRHRHRHGHADGHEHAEPDIYGHGEELYRRLRQQREGHG